MLRNPEVEKFSIGMAAHIACVLRGMARDGLFPWSSPND